MLHTKQFFMKRIYLSFLVAVLLPAFAFAQRGGANSYQRYNYDNMQYDNSVLSIFSENGEPFYLILNGMKQNMVPQTKIRVEALPKYQNDVQIMFADNRIQPIRRTINIADPIDGRAVNLTLRISRGRSGMYRLKFHRMTECDRNYHGPRDEYVMFYGKPQQLNTVTETTYMDPITGQWITETTTTTTENYNNNNRYNDNTRYNNNNNTRYNDNDYTPPPPAPVAMDMRTFSDAKKSIAGASFEDTKLSTAKTIIGANYVSTNQVMEICRMFSFEDSKLAFAKFAYPYTVDQQNYFKVASVFSFDASKTDLNNFISSGGR